MTTSLSAPPRSDAEDPVLRLIAATPPDGATCGDPGLHPGQIIEGKYVVRRLLGRGGMGFVYEALHLQTDKTVAIKLLRRDLARSADWIERFAREARTAGKLDHPNIVRIYDVGGEGAGTYIVMEYLHGETLRDRLRRGPMHHGEAIPTLLSVMRGVAEAHRLGVVHRDLKPDNIFLCTLPNGQPDAPKVLDFGVSKRLDSSLDLRADRTPLGHAAGTPLYMPLEQLQGTRVDVRGDVYALGVVLFETLTGAFPFPARNRDDLVVALATCQPSLLPAEAHPRAGQLNAILKCALARDASARYESVEALMHALSRVPVTRPWSRPSGASRTKLSAAALAMGLLLVPPSWPPAREPRPAASPDKQQSAQPDTERPKGAVQALAHARYAAFSTLMASNEAPPPAEEARPQPVSTDTQRRRMPRAIKRTPQASRDGAPFVDGTSRALDLRLEDF